MQQLGMQFQTLDDPKKTYLEKCRKSPGFTQAQAVLDALYATSRSQANAIVRAMEAELLRFKSGDRLALHDGADHWEIKVEITSAGWRLLDMHRYSDFEHWNTVTLCWAIVEHLALADAGITNLKVNQVCTSQQEALVEGVPLVYAGVGYG